MFLITGATGNIGRGVVDLLHRSGCDVRALVRRQSRGSELPDGVHLAVGDLDDADSVTAALHGVAADHARSSTARTARADPATAPQCELPQNPVDHLAVITPPPAPTLDRWQQGLDPRPRPVGQLTTPYHPGMITDTRSEPLQDRP